MKILFITHYVPVTIWLSLCWLLSQKPQLLHPSHLHFQHLKNSMFANVCLTDDNYDFPREKVINEHWEEINQNNRAKIYKKFVISRVNIMSSSASQWPAR